MFSIVWLHYIMPIITHVHYENCNYARIPGNIVFTNTSHPLYKFTLWLDQPLQYGKCLFMIDQHIIDAQSTDCLESLIIVFTMREPIHIHGKNTVTTHIFFGRKCHTRYH